MKIQTRKLIPLPMTELQLGTSEIWEADLFIFEQGRSYLVEAASGKGKTSLLSVIYGLRKDYKGSVIFDDEDIATFDISRWSQLRKQKLSFIFQGLELFDELSGMDNILLNNKITNYKSTSQIREMAQKLEVDTFLEKKCQHLSFGQKQRIAIIRSLCQPFEFLLADECFSHIDKEHSKDALDLILQECKSQESGLIISSLGNDRIKTDRQVNL